MKDLSINPLAGVQPGMGIKNPDASPASGFKEVLDKSIDAVNKSLEEAGKSAAGLVSGQHSNIHETMIAIEKANISFRLMTKAQNKVVEAFQEIMRLQL